MKLSGLPDIFFGLLLQFDGHSDWHLLTYLFRQKRNGLAREKLIWLVIKQIHSGQLSPTKILFNYYLILMKYYYLQ